MLKRNLPMIEIAPRRYYARNYTRDYTIGEPRRGTSEDIRKVIRLLIETETGDERETRVMSRGSFDRDRDGTRPCPRDRR